MTYFWLNFIDPDLPEESDFLGAAIVAADDFVEAVKHAHTMGCNPGGEVSGQSFECDGIPAEFAGRLLDRQAVGQFRTFWEQTG
jgi:hypothetical protein